MAETTAKWRSRVFVSLWSRVGNWTQKSRVRLADMLAWLSWHLPGERKQIASTNIALCFPQLSPVEQKAMRRRNLKEIARGLLETSLCWFGTDSRLLDRCTIHGLNFVRDQTKSGRGVMLLTPHFSTLEVGGKILGASLPAAFLYRPLKQPWLEGLVTKARSAYAEQAFSKRSVRAAMMHLRRGGVLWYAPDLYPGRHSNPFVPFFGHSTPSTQSVHRIARATGCMVVFGYAVRHKDGQSWEYHVSEPMIDFPGKDPSHDSARINSEIEKIIRRCPEQYLWTHRRFKAIDGLEGSPYER